AERHQQADAHHSRAIDAAGDARHRRVLRHRSGGRAGGGALAVKHLACVGLGRPGTYLFLNMEEAAFIEAAVARLIPAYLDFKGAQWTCGIDARDRLKVYVTGSEISCVDKATDRYNRILAICSLAGEDLNRWLVREGLALAYIQYSRLCVDSETEARHALRGLWSGAFIAPWDWRHRNKQTVILGALSVPVNAQLILLAPASANDAPSAECIIKGNVNRKGVAPTDRASLAWRLPQSGLQLDVP